MSDDDAATILTNMLLNKRVPNEDRRQAINQAIIWYGKLQQLKSMFLKGE